MLSKVSHAVLLLSCLSSSVVAYPKEHELTSLPGFDGDLPMKIYSGYVDSGEDGKYKKHSHYMFIESESDPENDPVVVWTNGGPGASSFFGLMVELGPFLLNGDSVKTEAFQKTGIPTFFRNEYAWTKFANVLILNSPPPVGYSYCDPVGPEGDGFSCGTWNDERTARTNRVFLENWVAKFPEFRDHDWFITGESYAGIYVPTLVRELLETKNTTFPVKNLRGFAVGDGCVGTDINCANQGPFWTMEFLHGHGQFSDKLYREIRDKCSNDELMNGVKTTACQKLIDEMNTQVGGYFEYNLYDECWYDTGFNGNRQLAAQNDYKCGGQTALNLWLDHPKVRKALHVSPTAKFFSGDNGAGFKYVPTERNLLPFYKDVIANTDLRVIVYNGDTDPGLNSFVAQNWTSSLGFKEEAPWRPWTLDGKAEVVGYVTRYEKQFDFLTIRGSGHMVPQFKPAAAFEFMQRWIANEPYQPYTPTKHSKPVYEVAVEE